MPVFGFKRYKNTKAEQLAFWNCWARFIAVPAGRRTGKTEIAYTKLIIAAGTDYGDGKQHLFILGMPTYAQAMNVAWRRLRKMCPAGYIRDQNKTLGYIETAAGHVIFIVGLQESERFEGNAYKGILLDEAADHNPDVIKSFLPALSDEDTLGFLWLIGTPHIYGAGAQMYREYCEQWARSDDPDEQVFHWTSEGIVPDVELERARRNMDEKLFRNQFYASFETATGQVYYAFNRNVNVTADESLVYYAPDEPLLVTCDFNLSPMSWVIAQMDMDYLGMCSGNIRVLDEISLTDSNTPETLDVLYSRWGGHPGGFKFYGDASMQSGSSSSATTDYKLIRDDKRFWNHGTIGSEMNVPKANPYVIDRIANMNAMLRSATGVSRLFIHPRCEKLIKDLEWVSFKKNTRQLDKSDPMATHMTDALGYLVNRVAYLGYKSEPSMGAGIILGEGKKR